VPGLINLGLGLLIALGMGIAVIRFLPHGWLWDKLVLNTAVDAAAQTAGGAAQATVAPDQMVGRQGVAATALRPSGQIDIDGKRYEARVQVGTVKQGAKVVVVRRTDFELIVEEVAS
jgi:membrane-bound serine protease (ClpP class)